MCAVAQATGGIQYAITWLDIVARPVVANGMSIRALTYIAQHVHMQTALGFQERERIRRDDRRGNLLQKNGDLPTILVELFIAIDAVVAWVLDETCLQAA